jgi:very-short-patch-repair endonuclease
MPMVSTLIRRAAAKRLRANMTPHERILWRALKELPVDGTHFRRQAPVGPYVVDFFCPAKHLIIELDGGHHNDDETARRDRQRQLWLEQEGYRVVRFWNSEVSSDLTAVLERIYVELHGSREAEVEPLKHCRRRETVTPPRPLRGRPPPPGEGEKSIDDIHGNSQFEFQTAALHWFRNTFNRVDASVAAAAFT